MELNGIYINIIKLNNGGYLYYKEVENGVEK